MPRIADLIQGFLDLAESAIGGIEQPLPLAGELYCPSGARQEAGAEVLLQAAHAFADGCGTY